MPILYDEDNNRQTNILTFSRKVRLIGLHGFILFLPCSVAFSQICLSLFALIYFIETFLKKHLQIPRTPLNRPVLAYCAVSLITAMFSLAGFPSMTEEVKDLLLIGIFFLCYIYIKDVSQLKKLTGLLSLYVTLAALYGVLQHFWEVDVFRLGRPISFLKHVNDDLSAPVRISGFLSYMTFSGQLAMAIPIIFALFLSSKTLSKRLLGAISLILTILALLWTYTRSAWIGTICAFILFGYLKGKKTFIVLLLLGICLISLAILQPEILDRSLSVFSTKENVERLYTWQSTIKMILDHPLAGIGKGNYSKLAPIYRTQYDFDFSSRAHAHNNLLQVTVTGGIPTLLCFLWLWGVIFKEVYRTYQRIPRESPALKVLSLGFLGAITGFFVQGFFEHNFGDVESVMMMWLIVAFSLKLQHLVCEA